MEETQEVRGGIGKSPKIEEEAKPAGGVDFKSSRMLFVILLIGVIVAIVAGSRAVPQRSTTPQQPSRDVGEIILSFLPWLLIILFVYFFFLRKIRFSTMEDIRKNQDAIVYLHAGELSDAARMFDELLSKKTDEYNMMVYRLNRASVWLAQGEVDKAKDQAAGVLADARKKFQNDKNSEAVVMATYGDIAACAGELEEAKKHIDEAEKSLRPAELGLILRPKVLIAMRRNDFASAEKIFVAGWRMAEGLKIGTDMKSLRVLRAFALSRLDRNAEQNDAMAKLIAGLYPYRAGEFDYLGAKWPEMKAFLIEQKLSAAG